MRRLGVVAAILAAVSLLGVPAGRAQGDTVFDAFDDPALPGWELGPGTYAEGGILHVGSGGFAFSPVRVEDATITARLRRFGTGHVVVQYRWGEAAGYSLVVTPVGISVEHSGERARHLGDVGIELPNRRWSTLSVTVRGATHVVRLDGSRILRVTDPEPLPAGGFGLTFLREGRMEVDEVAVRPAGPAATAPAPAPTPTPARGDLRWVRTGGPLGGLGYDVRMRPGDTDRMFVTDALAGVFISADGGATWAPSNTGITTREGESGDRIPVFSLTIDPHDPDTIWAGAQYTRGIFRSTDGGRTWKERDRGVVEQEGISFRGFTIDPRDPDIVYAAAELSSWAWSGQARNGREFDLVKGVVYRTTDGGAHWKAIWRGDNLARYVWIDPRDPDVIYISTGIFDREAGNSVPNRREAGGEGVVKSTDGGRSWQRVNDGLGNLYVGSLFMHPDDPDVLLAGAGHVQYYEGDGVYLTSDGARTWRQTLANDVITSVEFAVSDPSIAYAGSSASVYRSRDGGLTWQLVAGPNGWGPPGVVAGFPIDFQVDPADPDRIFANNYGGGNFLSTDGGRTWVVASTGYTGAQVRAIAVDPAAPGRVYAAARSGLYRSDDGGAAWVGLASAPANALEWNALGLDPTDGTHLVAGNSWQGRLLTSADGGRTMTQADGGLPSDVWFRSVAFAPGEPATVYAGSGAFVSAGQFSDPLAARGVFVSADGGRTWAPANDELSDDAQVPDLAVDPSDARRVFAASTNHGLLLTEDGGASWRVVTGRRTAWARSIAIAPERPDHLLAGLAPGGVHRSTDGGANWRTTVGVPPEAEVTDIMFDPAEPGTVYASDRKSGVYRSRDGGATWKRLVAGLDMRSTMALAISADGRHLYAATEGGGVYRLDLDGVPPAAAPLPGPATTPSPEAPVPTVRPATAGPEAPVASAGPTPAPAPVSAEPSADVAVPLAVGAALVVAGGGLVAWLARRRRAA